MRFLRSKSSSKENLSKENLSSPPLTPGEQPPSYAFSTNSSPTQRPTPLNRQSSASLLRLEDLDKKKKKNVPYRPAPEQQKFIDKLGSPSVTALSASSSAAHTEYFDVLPSFQMFQSILKRDDEQFGENLSIEPPQYGDTANSAPSPPALSPMSSQSSVGSVTAPAADTIDGVLQDEYDFDENYGFGEDEASDGLQNNNTNYYSQTNISRAHDTYGHTVLDNMDRLPKLNNSPIDIQIFVTKQVPIPHNENELETRLKEHSNNDMVNGYIIIHNTSDSPVKFGLFTVSLEGTIKAAEKAASGPKFSKVLMKKFLKMYDLNASYGYTDVPNSAGIEYESFTDDRYDGTSLGLPDERILKPKTKYKKFFTFKFPNRLLDDVCASNTIAHLLPPPSLGIDKTAFSGQADNIELNKALGYGCLSSRGTPLLTRDYGFDDMSVAYCIEAKFIDKVNSSQDEPLSHSEINDSDNLKKYVISRSSQYFLRFVPNLKHLLDLYNQEVIFGNETFGSIGIDGKLFSHYLYTTTWRAFNEFNAVVENEISARLDRDELSSEEIKNKNLIDTNLTRTTIRRESIIAKENQTRQQETSDEHYYIDQRMIGSKFAVNIFGKKKKKMLSTMVKVGILKLYVQVPKQPLTYESPKLIRKYNRSDRYDPKENDLMPVNSITSNRINDLYHRDEEDFSRSINVCLEFEPLDSSSKPPSIASIDVNIVSWSFRSDYPLPCTIEYDFFYESLSSKEETNQSEIVKNNLQQVKDQTANYIHFLKSNRTFISKNSYLYLKSIKTLGIKCDTIKEYFHPVTSSSCPEAFDDNWEIRGKKYNKKLTLPLKVSNKHNVNLIPSFQSCLVGRLYCLQVVVRYKGNDKPEENLVVCDVPILVG